jgi:hypothetical protein
VPAIVSRQFVFTVALTIVTIRTSAARVSNTFNFSNIISHLYYTFRAYSQTRCLLRSPVSAMASATETSNLHETLLTYLRH